MTAPRRLIARLRESLSAGSASAAELVHLVASELAAEVCSLYALREGDLLELRATWGLNQGAVGRTRLRVGEGIVGIVAATGQRLNLADAQSHPAFADRPETGEQPFASLLAVPVRRAGRTLGVLAVQTLAPRRFGLDEVEGLETAALLLGELLLRDRPAPAGGEQGLTATLPRQLSATPLAPGIAIGPVLLASRPRPNPRPPSGDAEAEIARLEAAMEAMRRGLDALIAARSPPGDAPREVLEATRLVAADDGWLRRVAEAVRGGLSAEEAVSRVAGDLRARMRRIADPYLRERLADLEDLAGRLMAELGGEAEQPASVAGCILLARRLGPAQLLDWHARGIAGVAIEEGSAAGHAAIMARALGLPTLGGVAGMLEAVLPGDTAVLDADGGALFLRPEAELAAAYARAIEGRRARAAGWAALRHVPSRTADGTSLRLMLNVGLDLELEGLEATGAAGIGLFRTEIAALARGGVGNVAEQAVLYSRVLDVAGDRPVHFRTLDLGGDKLLPQAREAEEENPAMGWRSLRVGLDRPAVLRRQCRALLLAAGGRPLSVMFPMVATLAEFRAARALLLAEAARVRPAPERLRVGSMLEVPALLWQMPALLQEVDFLSVGSNDLMQFLFAADRGTAAVAARYDLLCEPVLSLLDTLRDQAAAAGVPLSVCGEAASRPPEALVLAALGITELSMPATSLPVVKEAMVTADLDAFRPVLAAMRRRADGAGSLREGIVGWAREHGVGL